MAALELSTMEERLLVLANEVEDKQLYELAAVVLHPLGREEIENVYAAKKGDARKPLVAALRGALLRTGKIIEVGKLLPIPMYNEGKHALLVKAVEAVMRPSAKSGGAADAGAGGGARAGADGGGEATERILALLESIQADAKADRKAMEQMSARLTSLEEERGNEQERSAVVLEETGTARTQQEKDDEAACGAFFGIIDDVLRLTQLPAKGATAMEMRLWKIEREAGINKFMTQLKAQAACIGSGPMGFERDRMIKGLQVSFDDVEHPPVRSQFIYQSRWLIVNIMFCSGMKALSSRLATRWGIGKETEAFPLAAFKAEIKAENEVTKEVAKASK